MGSTRPRAAHLIFITPGHHVRAFFLEIILRIEKNELATALRHAGTVRPDRIALAPSGAAVTLNAAEKGHGGVVTQMSIAAECGGDEAPFQVPYQHFRSIVESMPDGVLDVRAASNDAVTVQNGKTKLKARAIFNPALDLLDATGANAQRVLDGAAIRSAIAQTIHAIPSKDVREYLTSMRLDVEDGVAAVVGTDGRRMMISRFAVTDSGDAIGISIVNPAIPMVAAMADKGNIRVYIKEKTVVIAQDQWMCRIPVISGYPNWRRTLARSASPDPAFTVSAVALLDAMKRMIVVAEGEAGQARYGHGVYLKQGDGGLSITLAGNDSEDLVAIDHVEGDINITADARQLADLLGAVGDADVRITHVGGVTGSSRILVVPDNDRDQMTAKFTSIVTELRI